jgi:hypothetical protein
MSNIGDIVKTTNDQIESIYQSQTKLREYAEKTSAGERFLSKLERSTKKIVKELQDKYKEAIESEKKSCNFRGAGYDSKRVWILCRYSVTLEKLRKMADKFKELESNSCKVTIGIHDPARDEIKLMINQAILGLIAKDCYDASSSIVAAGDILSFPIASLKNSGQRDIIDLLAKDLFDMHAPQNPKKSS